MAYESGGQDAHETRQQHQPRLVAIDQLDQCGVEAVSVRELPVIQRSHRDIGLLCSFQAVGVCPVADDRLDFDGKAVFRGIDDGLKVASTPDINTTIGSSDIFYASCLAVTGFDAADGIYLFTVGLQDRPGTIYIGRGQADHHADATVEGAEHFLVGDVAVFL